MSESSGKKQAGEVLRQAAETALDVAVGGTVLAADKALETVEVVVARAEDLASAARRESAEADVTGVGDGRPYEERTRDELYELAARRGIEGRSRMRKAELVAALRDER